ncbi:transposase [Streptomyces massasporeus]
MIDSSQVRAAQQGPVAGLARSTACLGSKHPIITDGQGIPLAVSLTGGNPNDVTQLLPLHEKIHAVEGAPARHTPRRPRQIPTPAPRSSSRLRRLPDCLPPRPTALLGPVSYRGWSRGDT